MRIAPFAELLEHARERYRERVQSLPEPTVINQVAAVSMDAPRCFAWGGLVYWVPPLGFEDGLRLFVAAMALRDRPGVSIEPHHIRTAAHLIYRAIRPTFVARVIHAFRGNPFLRDSAEDLHGLADWLTHVPDESNLLPSEERVTLDLVDARYAFEGYFKRPPRSWADYVYGCRHMGRHSAREALRLAAAVRTAHGADKKEWEGFVAETRSAAGW